MDRMTKAKAPTSGLNTAFLMGTVHLLAHDDIGLRVEVMVGPSDDPRYTGAEPSEPLRAWAVASEDQSMLVKYAGPGAKVGLQCRVEPSMIGDLSILVIERILFMHPHGGESKPGT